MRNGGRDGGRGIFMYFSVLNDELLVGYGEKWLGEGV